MKNNESEKLKELILNANKIRGILEGETPELVKNEERLIKFYTK
jgi:prephenate dehydrogenase